jgi:hypothetical protein
MTLREASQKLYDDYWHSINNGSVTAIGIREIGSYNDTESIVIYVKNKKCKTNLGFDNLTEYEGFPVSVIISGKIRPC